MSDRLALINHPHHVRFVLSLSMRQCRIEASGLARKLLVPTARVNQWLSGNDLIPAQYLVKIATELELEEDEFRRLASANGTLQAMRKFENLLFSYSSGAKDSRLQAQNRRHAKRVLGSANIKDAMIATCEEMMCGKAERYFAIEKYSSDAKTGLRECPVSINEIFTYADNLWFVFDTIDRILIDNYNIELAFSKYDNYIVLKSNILASCISFIDREFGNELLEIINSHSLTWFTFDKYVDLSYYKIF